MNNKVVELLSCDGVAPTGPVSAWPQTRNEEVQAAFEATQPKEGATKVKASLGQMARGLARNAGTAIQQGKVSQEIRKKRWETCQSCPSLIKDSSRCAECGCFMKAKTWLNGDPMVLCPLQKWAK